MDKKFDINAKKSDEGLELEIHTEGVIPDDVSISLARRIAVLVNAEENSEVGIDIMEKPDSAVAVFRFRSEVEPDFAKNIVRRYIENSQIKEYIIEPEIIDAEEERIRQEAGIVPNEWLDAEWFEINSKYIADEIERAIKDDAYLPEGLSLDEKLKSDFTVMEITGLKDSIVNELKQEMLKWYLEPAIVSGKQLKEAIQNNDIDKLVNLPFFAGLDRVVVGGITSKLDINSIKDDGVYLIGKRPEIGKALLISSILKGFSAKKDATELLRDFLIFAPIGAINLSKWLATDGVELARKTGTKFKDWLGKKASRRGVDLPPAINISSGRNYVVVRSHLAGLLGRETALKLSNATSFQEIVDVSRSIGISPDLGKGRKPKMGM